MRDIKTLIKQIKSDLILEIKLNLSKESDGLTLIGSCVSGKICLAKPDIGFILLIKRKAEEQVLIKLSKIFSKLQKNYEKEIIIKPDFRPFKLAYNNNTKLPELTISGIVANLDEKNSPNPFGIPKCVLAGMKLQRKVIFGCDILKQVDTKINKEYLLDIAIEHIGVVRTILKRTPLTLDLDKEYTILLAESVNCAKIAMRYGVEIVCKNKELESGIYLDFFTDKKNMITFYKDRYSTKASKLVKKILDARERYLIYRKQQSKAMDIFFTSYKLVNIIWLRLLKERVQAQY